MKIGIQSLYDNFNTNNNIFNSEVYPIGENLEYPIVLLREHLIEKGCSLDTLDIYPLEQYGKIIFLDFPNLSVKELQKLINSGKELYLILLESELIYPKNFIKKNHIYFNKIFTWADSLVDNIKYYKLNLCNKIPESFSIDLNVKNKFCTNISGNKKSRKINELYSERQKAIDWFENNHPNQFDLYGFDWDNYTFSFPFGRLNNFPFLRKLLRKNYSTYRGSIDNKIETLKQYRFSICYENIRSNNGYISEKIFDCFFAGTIPIYLGEEKISDFIPQNLYIDKRNFKSYDELYDYMISMSSEDYKNYVRSIENYVNSSEIYPFSAECFSNVIVSHLV